MNYDVIVVGVGGMGSAIIDHLSRRGARTLGIERFGIANDMGSSHGHTRIIRKAYFERPSYVPLILRAYELWQELEEDVRQQLLITTGSLDIGKPGDPVFEGALLSSRTHGLEHESISARDIMGRFPGFNVPEDFNGVYQPDGGFLLSELCVSAHAARAEKNGATIHAQEQVLSWTSSPDGVTVVTDQSTYQADRLVLSGGAWNAGLVPGLGHLMVPERQVLGWFSPRNPEPFQHDRMPVFLINVEEGCYYGFPDYENRGVKLGLFHHLRQTVDPDTTDRETHEEDEAPLRTFVEKYFNGANGPTIERKTCMFTNTPDEHFILDHLPGNDRVVLAGGFSGHGFKFASVIGEIMSDLALDGVTRHDIEFMRADRFSETG
jgi:sarcosine oxidase